MPSDPLIIAGPAAASRAECAAILRSLPEWFGIEPALLRYAAEAEVMPTFTAREEGWFRVPGSEFRVGREQFQVPCSRFQVEAGAKSEDAAGRAEKDPHPNPLPRKGEGVGRPPVIGFLTIKRHFPASAEVHVIAVHRDWRGRGVGSALLAAAEGWLRAGGVRVLQVKTLSAAHPDPHYAQTREFYLRRGFVPLEEMPHLWNEANPCLVMVKALGEP